MSRRRILYVEANEDGSVGGSHQVLYDMVRALDRTSFEPVVLFYQTNRFVTLFRDAGIETLSWDEIRHHERTIQITGSVLAKIRGWLSAIGRRHALLQSMRVDLVHMNNSPRTGRTDWLPAARLARIPVVASARGDADPLPGRGVRSHAHRWLMRRFDRVIAVSHYIADSWRLQGVASAKVVVVHDGVDRTRLASIGRRPANEIRAELGVPLGRVFIACVGNVRSWKGQHVVIESLGLLSPIERASLFVAFVGAVRSEDEAYMDQLTQRASELRVSGSIRFVGSRTNIPEIMSVADIVVHSSTMPEPGGTVVIEAMTFGAPVIVASKGGHLDYLQPGLGLVHDVNRPEELAKHVRFLVENEGERSRMAAAAKLRAVDFSIQETSRKMQRLYGELVR